MFLGLIRIRIRTCVQSLNWLSKPKIRYFVAKLCLNVCPALFYHSIKQQLQMVDNIALDIKERVWPASSRCESTNSHSSHRLVLADRKRLAGAKCPDCRREGK